MLSITRKIYLLFGKLMIHPSAYVSQNAKVAASACIGPWCIVEDFAEIGENVILESRVRVLSHVKIGAESQIFDGAILGQIPQDLKFNGEETVLEIGKRCIIREYATLHRGTASTGKTLVGDDTLIMAYSHVAHDCQIGKGVVISNGVQLAGHVQIGDYANLGGTAGVSQNCRIGAYSFVGAALKVDRDVPPYVKALGNPLRFAGVNLHALRRFPQEFPEERIIQIEKIYRELFHSRRPFAELAQEMAKSEDFAIRQFFSAENFPMIR